jgi:Xaa-Pro aminopeptidase
MNRAATVRHSLALLLLAASSALAGPAAGQGAGRGIASAEYAARRDSLAAHIRNGAVVAFGAPEPVTDLAPFRQLPAFAYLTGFEEPDAAFLMVAREGHPVYAMLFQARKDPRMVLYTGFPADSAKLSRELGLGVRFLDALRPALDAALASGAPLWEIRDYATRDAVQADSLTRGRVFVASVLRDRPAVRLRDAHPVLDSLMVPKSAAEQRLLRRAAEITMAGQEAAMRAVAPGRREAAAQAAAEYVFRVQGDGPSFGSIVGSGPNSTSYHYRRNDRVMQAGDVVVMDMGALYQGYAADVTRTVPVSGTFTADQRAVYQLVRDAQAAAEKLVRAGAPVDAGSDAVRAVEAAGLAKLGLIESPDATFDPPWPADCASGSTRCRQAFLYMAHGLGHGIGLEVHDAGGYSYSPTGTFQLGEVFTIEPGIYISNQLLDMLPDTPKNRAFIARVRPAVQRYHDIGVRIEDDYIVTATGAEWISRGPREIAEVEAAMRQATP